MSILSGDFNWLTRFCFQRALAGIYCIGFLIALNQYRALVGRNGLLPMDLFAQRVKFWDAPSLFYFNQSDTFILILGGVGLALSIFALIGYSDAFGTIVSVLTWFLLWVLYSSFVNYGQTFYGFGWEILLLETGFLAIFLGPSSSKPSVIVIFLLRWLLFRLMFGAGLIKIRGDECWRDLTCMNYHYETMPLPGPASWFFHQLPQWIQKFSVLLNHFAELIVPFFYFFPRPFRHTAGVITVLFHVIIILSGNFSWLNYLTLVIAIALFDDTFLANAGTWLTSWAKTFGVAGLDLTATAVTGVPQLALYALAAVIAYLSVGPVRNMLSPGQIMNTSFDPLNLVNTYGAFGSITRTRNEIILEGADSLDGPWSAYEFRGKPGDPSRLPPLVSPYHYKIDWQMWFAAMTNYTRHPWLLNLIAKILQNDAQALALLAPPPPAFTAHAPKYVRAQLYEYHYTKPGEKNWWRRELTGEYLPPLSLDNEAFSEILKEQGWLRPSTDTK